MRMVSLLRDGLDVGVNLLLWVNELDAVSEGTVSGFGEDSIGLDPSLGAEPVNLRAQRGTRLDMGVACCCWEGGPRKDQRLLRRNGPARIRDWLV